MPVFAQDEVQKGGTSTIGKITAYSDGLIQVRKSGVVSTVIREKNSDLYNDFVSYRERPIGGSRVDVNCRVLFIDDYHVIFKTPVASRVEIPRYRVSTIVLNAN